MVSAVDVFLFNISSSLISCVLLHLVWFSCFWFRVLLSVYYLVWFHVFSSSRLIFIFLVSSLVICFISLLEFLFRLVWFSLLIFLFRIVWFSISSLSSGIPFSSSVHSDFCASYLCWTKSAEVHYRYKNIKISSSSKFFFFFYTEMVRDVNRDTWKAILNI